MLACHRQSPPGQALGMVLGAMPVLAQERLADTTPGMVTGMVTNIVPDTVLGIAPAMVPGTVPDMVLHTAPDTALGTAPGMAPGGARGTLPGTVMVPGTTADWMLDKEAGPMAMLAVMGKTCDQQVTLALAI